MRSSSHLGRSLGYAGAVSPHPHFMVLLLWSSLLWRHLGSWSFVSSPHPHPLRANGKGSFLVNRCGRGHPHPHAQPHPPRCHVRLDLAAECAQSPPTSPVSTPWPGGPFFCVSQMAAVPFLLLSGHLALPRPLPPPWHYSLCRSDGNLTIR